jgi:hypothetical protein
MRSKAEIFEEHFNVRTWEEADKISRANRESDPQLPLSRYTKLMLPYEASTHPGIPSLQEIEVAMENNKLSNRFSFRDVCRVGNTVVKVCWAYTIIQVSTFSFISLQRIN